MPGGWQALGTQFVSAGARTLLEAQQAGRRWRAGHLSRLQWCLRCPLAAQPGRASCLGRPVSCAAARRRALPAAAHAASADRAPWPCPAAQRAPARRHVGLRRGDRARGGRWRVLQGPAAGAGGHRAVRRHQLCDVRRPEGLGVRRRVRTGPLALRFAAAARARWAHSAMPRCPGLPHALPLWVRCMPRVCRHDSRTQAGRPRRAPVHLALILTLNHWHLTTSASRTHLTSPCMPPRACADARARRPQSTPGNLAIGAAAGTLASSVCYPLDTVRRRMQMRGRTYAGQADAFRTIWRLARPRPGPT